MKRALIAMSGGVDSSVAALLLQREGWDCSGVTLRLVRGSDLALPGHRSCCTPEDAEEAAYVCYQLGIPHDLLDLSGLFRVRVMQHFADEYARGHTPNPCIDCNRYLKFEALLDSRTLLASGFHWLSIPVPEWPLRVTARTRYRQREQPAVVRALSCGRIELVFDAPQRAVTPGQAVVLYDGELVLGGGTIERVIR